MLLFKWDLTAIMNTLAFLRAGKGFNCSALLQVHIASC